MVLHPTIEDTPKGSKEHKKTLASTQPCSGRHLRGGGTEYTQHERRDEEEGEGGLSRFGGSEPICFKSVNGDPNVLEFASNIVSLFYSETTSIWSVGLRIG